MRKMLVTLMAVISITVISLADGGSSTTGTGKFVCTQYDMDVSISSLTVAKNCVTNSALWKGAPVTKTYDSIAFTDSATGTYAFPCVMWPGSNVFGDGKNGFVVLATAKIVIPETGDWTFACFSDDGFELKLSNGGNEYTMLFEEARAADYTLRTFNLAAGIYDLNFTYFEHTNDAVCFLSAARGAYSSFDATAFKLVGEAANGITLANTSAITFDANGGTVMPSAVVCLKGMACGPLPIPSKACHVFDGWYMAPEGGDKITPETVFDNDVKLYAHWRGTISVSNVKVFSGYPWHEVVIGYKIAGSIDRPVCLQISAADNASGAIYDYSTGDAAYLTTGDHIIKWNASANGMNFKSENIVFTVKIVDPVYCVIDLSGGASATNYPVAGLMEVPSGGWTEEYKTTKLVLRRIDAGQFWMQNQYKISLTEAFYIGVFEVTQKQYKLVTGTSNSYHSGDSNPQEGVSYNGIRGSSMGTGWPVDNVVDEDSFLGKLRTKTGYGFDLPTEAQWEYACRAGTTSSYNNGSDSSCPGRCDPKLTYPMARTNPVAVGSYQPNAWGLYDMHGNVCEWCLDWYGNIGGGLDPKGVSEGTERVLRGGSWLSSKSGCTSSSRGSASPSSYETRMGVGYTPADGKYRTIEFHAGYGFRLSWTPRK